MLQNKQQQNYTRIAMIVIVRQGCCQLLCASRVFLFTVCVCVFFFHQNIQVAVQQYTIHK